MSTCLDFKLIDRDANPRPELQKVLHAIGRYFAFDDPSSAAGIRPRITPDKLKKFYQRTSAHPDQLAFWDSTNKHISTVYTILRIPHTLEQPKGQYGSKPSIPTLDLYGFEKWMMHHLLLNPDEASLLVQKAFALGMFDGLDAPIFVSGMLKKGIPRDCFPRAPHPLTVEETHKKGIHSWKNMNDHSYIKRLRRASRSGRKPERGESQKSQHRRPTVESVSDDSSDDSAYIVRGRTEKSSFTYRLPVLNLSGDNSSNEAIHSPNRWQDSDSVNDSTDTEDYSTHRQDSRNSSPSSRYSDSRHRMPSRNFELLTSERRTPFSTPSSSRSPNLRPVDRSYYTSEIRVHSTERGRETHKEAWGFRGFGNGGSILGEEGHNGYGNGDSDDS